MKVAKLRNCRGHSKKKLDCLHVRGRALHLPGEPQQFSQ